MSKSMKDSKTKRAEKEYKKQVNDSAHGAMAFRKPCEKARETFFRPAFYKKKED